MNCLILNRESFELPADGWYQLAPLGEFPHEGAGVVQVVDAAACEHCSISDHCTVSQKTGKTQNS